MDRLNRESGSRYQCCAKPRRGGGQRASHGDMLRSEAISILAVDLNEESARQSVGIVYDRNIRAHPFQAVLNKTKTYTSIL
jgi:uncharacterized UPF0146 family protein